MITLTLSRKSTNQTAQTKPNHPPTNATHRKASQTHRKARQRQRQRRSNPKQSKLHPSYRTRGHDADCTGSGLRAGLDGHFDLNHLPMPRHAVDMFLNPDEFTVAPTRLLGQLWLGYQDWKYLPMALQSFPQVSLPSRSLMGTCCITWVFGIRQYAVCSAGLFCIQICSNAFGQMMHQCWSKLPRFGSTVDTPSHPSLTVPWLSGLSVQCLSHQV